MYIKFKDKDLINVIQTKFKTGQQVFWPLMGKIYKGEVNSSHVELKNSKEGKFYKRYYIVKCIARTGDEYFENFEEDFLFESEQQVKNYFENLNSEPIV